MFLHPPAAACCFRPDIKIVTLTRSRTPRALITIRVYFAAKMSRKHATAPLRRLLAFLVGLGPLRVTLLLATLVLLVAVPKPGTHPEFHGWGMVPTLIVPTLAPIVFMVLLLDAIMSGVFMSGKRDAERARLKYIAIMQLLLAAAQVTAWYPYFRAIMSP